MSEAARKGYRVLFTPHAKLYHFEAISKRIEDKDPRPAEALAFKTRWKKVIENDPFYSPNLTRTAENYSYRKSLWPMPDQELSFLGRSALRTLKRLRFPGILDQMVTSYPSEQNALDIFKNEWSSKLPLARSDLQAGPIPLFEDPRVHWAVCEAGGVANQRVLELGPLEGGHTYMLQERGAASILAIEANTRAFLKCLIVKNIFNLHKADFRCGDFISFLRQNTERFDFVLATGVLYHMTSPVELLQLLSRVTDRLFMWTHYYDEAIISRKS